MAKKTQSPEPAATTSESAGTLAEAIREALADLGIDSSRAEVAGWIKEKYPSMQYKEATLNSSLSNIKKKMREEAGLAGGSPTVNEVLRVKTLAENRGGVEQMMSFVDDAETLAKKFGGLDRLRKCLDMVKRIRD